jgi:pimeloyl-ACP methyl ester carboxylesterase
MTAPIHARDIYVTANGLRHHVIARGKPGGRAIMLVHGLTQQAHVFDGIATALAEEYHVYALDVRGRGESEWGPADGYYVANYVADLEAVREALGLELLTLIGTSMGGMIAMQYTAQYPDRVQRAVLNDIGPEIDPAGGARIMQMLASAPTGFKDLKAVVKYYREENAPMLRLKSDDDVSEYARWHVRHSDNGLYVWKMDPAVRQRPSQPVPPAVEPWEALKAMQCPVLVVRGAESDVLSADACGRMVAALPGGSSVEVPGVGHAPSLMEPEAKTALMDFLAR